MLNLIKYEFKKLFSNKIMIFFLIIIILLNIWLITKDISQSMVNQNIALKRLITSYLEDPEATEDYINNYNSEYYAVLKERKETGNTAIPFPDDVFTKNLNTKYESDYYFLNAEFKNLKENSNNIKKKINNAIKIANSQIMEYEYLEYSKTSFDYAYQLGVANSYSNIVEIDFPIVHISGYNVLMFYEGFGVISMIAMIICGLLFVIPDKTVKMYPILMVSKNGRTKTFFAKLIVSFIFCSIVCIALDITSLIAVSIKLGLSGGDAPLQMLNSFYENSKETFLLCPFPITIFQGFLLTCVIRLFSSFTFLCIIIMISNIFSSYTFSIIMGVIFTSINYVLAKINYLNSYHPLANLNFFVNINGYKLINYWRGIKLSDRAIPLIESSVLLFVFLIIVSLTTSYFLFVKGKGFNFRFLSILLEKFKAFIKKKKNKSIETKNKPKKNKHPKTIFSYECKKIFTPIALVIILLVFISTIYFSNETFNSGISFDEKIYKNVISEYEGEWTIEKHNSIIDKAIEYKKIISKYEEMNEQLVYHNITTQEYIEYYSMYEKANLELPVITNLISISENLKKLNDQGINVSFVNELGWKKLFTTNISYLYLIAFIIIFSNIYSIEYKEDFGKILKSTKFRNKTTIDKTIISIVFTTIFIVLLELIQYIVFKQSFTLNDPSAVAKSISIFTERSSPLYNNSLISVLIINYVKIIVLSNVFVIFTSIMSRLTKRLLPTLVIGSTIAFAPTLFTYFGFDFMNNISLITLLGRS